MLNLFKRSPLNYLSQNKRFYSHNLKNKADVVVLGGGISGASTLYHLAKKGITNTVLIEKHQITSGTTWHSAGLFWSCRPNDIDIEIGQETRDLASNILENETGINTGWNNNGGLFLANSNERLNEYKRMHTLAKFYGIESHILNKGEIKDLYPLMNVDDLVGGLYSPTDGTIEPDGITRAYCKGATNLGASIIEDCTVEDIMVNNKQVTGVKTSKGMILTQNVVNCMGVWSKELCNRINVNVPLYSMKHAYIVSDKINGIENTPNVRDHDLSIYFKLQGDKICLGGYETNPLFWKPDNFPFSLFELDWDIFDQHIVNHIHRLPIIENTGIVSTVCGPESFTPDHKPLLGETPEVKGLYLNCGHNSLGITASAGCGKEVANWIIDGYPEKDMFNYDINRFHNSYTNNEKWIKNSSHEAYTKNYNVVWPHDEYLSGRNLLIDPLHNTLSDKGAFFGSSGGIERPLYFNKDDGPFKMNKYNCDDNSDNSSYYQELTNYYTFDWPQNQIHTRKEHLACRNNTVLFNQSSFGKFLLDGKDSEKVLELLSTNNMDKGIGSTVYTVMCNKNGGIETDMTVSHIGENKFYLVIGSKFNQYGFSWIDKFIKNNRFDCQLTDVTFDFGVISIMGRDSRNILETISDTSFDPNDFKFSSNKLINFNKNKDLIRAIRITYVGELGWELHIPEHLCDHIYNLLHVVGSKYDISDAGYNAIESLSMEKSYRHWHSDIRSDDTPIEAGLDFICKLKNNKEFIGRDIIENQKKNGLTKKLICLTLNDNIPIHGNELIYRNNECVGYVRRANYSFCNEKPVCYGYIYSKDDEIINSDYLNNSKFQLEIMNQLYDANYEKKPIFDPKNNRIKGIY